MNTPPSVKENAGLSTIPNTLQRAGDPGGFSRRVGRTHPGFFNFFF